MHRLDDGSVPIEGGRNLASQIPGAKFLELPGSDHSFIGEREITDQIVGALEEFLTGKHSEPDPDRVLATVLFTDIVGFDQARDRARRPRLAHSVDTTQRDGASRTGALPRARGQDAGRRLPCHL